MLDPIDGYNAWSTNRGGSDKGGGGLTILYKNCLTAHQYTPSVPANLEYIMNERQWLLVNNGKDHLAFLHTYIACQNNRDDSFLTWNEDLFFLLTQEAKKLKQRGFTVICMGDFNTRVGRIQGLENNTPDHNQNTPMFLNFLNEVNLMIINTLPVAKGVFTRFLDSSGRPGTRSLLDYGLIDHDKSNTVTSFVIDETARVDCGTDHALLECIITFTDQPKLKWSYQEPIHYNIKGADFTEYQKNLDIELSLPFSQFSKQSTDDMLPHLTESLNASAKETFGLKMKKKKRGRKLPKDVITLIKTKNDLARLLHHPPPTHNPLQALQMHQELRSLKTQIKDKISGIKLQRRSRLRSQLLLADPNRKKFWRFLKGQMKTAGNITALATKDGDMVFEQEQIEETILKHFTAIFEGKRVPVTPSKPSPDQVEAALQELDQILGQKQPVFESDHFEKEVCRPYNYTELDQILQKLPSGKASGYDRYLKKESTNKQN